MTYFWKNVSRGFLKRQMETKTKQSIYLDKIANEYFDHDAFCHGETGMFTDDTPE